MSFWTEHDQKTEMDLIQNHVTVLLAYKAKDGREKAPTFF